jgi:hypothetical protein
MSVRPSTADVDQRNGLVSFVPLPEVHNPAGVNARAAWCLGKHWATPCSDSRCRCAQDPDGLIRLVLRRDSGLFNSSLEGNAKLKFKLGHYRIARVRLRRNGLYSRRSPSPRGSRKSRDAGSRPFGDDPSRKRIQNPSPGAVGPASRLRRRYAEAPAAALLTGLRVAVGPASRLRRRYADAPAAASFCFSLLLVPAIWLTFFI